MIGEKIPTALRERPGLVLHILAAAGEEQQPRGGAGDGDDWPVKVRAMHQALKGGRLGARSFAMVLNP